MATKKIIEVDVVNSLSDSDTIFVNSSNSLKQISKSNLVIKGADGKSAYQYAVEGGYTGTEVEFAAKLAAEIPTTLPNPNALTFTGAVTGSYDGSEPLTVEIPGGGAEAEHMEIISEGTLSEDVANIAADGFSKRMIALAVAPYGSAANSGNIKVRLQLGLDNGGKLNHQSQP